MRDISISSTKVRGRPKGRPTLGRKPDVAFGGLTPARLHPQLMIKSLYLQANTIARIANGTYYKKVG